MTLRYVKILQAVFDFLFLQNRKPSYLILFVTNKCEARCKHCFYWKETNKEIDELTIAEISRLAENLGPMVQVTITGGSPELRNDLPEVIRTFVLKCSPVNITLCSNGNYPEVLFSIVSAILSDFPKLHLTIDLSLDGLFDKHDFIRGIDGLFSNVIRSYNLLSDLKKGHAGLRLGCGLVVSGFNFDDAEETAKWALSNLPIDNFTPVLVRGEPRSEKALNVDADVFRKLSERTETMLLKRKLKGYSAFPRIINAKDILQKRIIHKTYIQKDRIIRCNALRETAVIYPDGKIGCCELRTESPGNIREFNMEIGKVWRSRMVRDLRKKIKAERCFCWHQCFLSGSVLKSPSMWLPFLKIILKS